MAARGNIIAVPNEVRNWAPGSEENPQDLAGLGVVWEEMGETGQMKSHGGAREMVACREISQSENSSPKGTCEFLG